MTETENSGAQKERRRRLRYWTLVTVVMLLGLIIGLAGRTVGPPQGSLSPSLATFLAGSFVLLIGVGNWIYYRSVDELEWASNLAGGFWGFYAIITAWPAWLLLWKGGLVPVPNLQTIILGGIAVATLVFLWKKYF